MSGHHDWLRSDSISTPFASCLNQLPFSVPASKILAIFDYGGETNGSSHRSRPRLNRGIQLQRREQGARRFSNTCPNRRYEAGNQRAFHGDVGGAFSRPAAAWIRCTLFNARPSKTGRGSAKNRASTERHHSEPASGSFHLFSMILAN
jgi:hypothetical protein